MSESLQERVKRLQAAGFYPDKILCCMDASNRPVVAVVGMICDWAAYRGQPEWDYAHTKENGDKISQKEAERLFPEFKKLQYRE